MVKQTAINPHSNELDRWVEYVKQDEPEICAADNDLSKEAIQRAVQSLEFRPTPDLSDIQYTDHFKMVYEDEEGEHTEAPREEQKNSLLECAAELPLILAYTGWIPQLKNNIFFTSFVGRKVEAWPNFEENEWVEDPVQLSLNSHRVVWKTQIGASSKLTRGPDAMLNPMLRGHQQHAPFVPNHPNIENGTGLLYKQAEHMVERCKEINVELDVNLLYHSMLYMLRKNLEAFNHCEIIRFSPLPLTMQELHGKHWDPETEQWIRHRDEKGNRTRHLPEKQRVLFSPQEIRDNFREIQKEYGDDKEAASIEFLKRLNAFPAGCDISDITREIRRAHSFLSKVIAMADEIDAKNFTPDFRSLEAMSRDEINIASRLHDKSLFELLEMIYDKKTRKTYLDNGDERTLIEGAIMAGIVSLFWSTHYHPIYKSQDDLIKALNNSIDSITNGGPMEVMYVPELRYVNDSFKFTNYKRMQAYRLDPEIVKKVLNEEDINEQVAEYTPLISVEEANMKGVSQSVDKMSGKSPDKRLEDLTDTKRARLMVSWTSKEVRDDEKKKDILSEILAQVASQLNMGEPDENARKTLETSLRKQWFNSNGELEHVPRSIIKDDTKKPYSKMKLIGYDKSGGMVEVQIIFTDTHAFDHAKDSPISHKKLELLRPLAQIKTKLYASAYGTSIHTAVDDEIKSITDGQEASQRAQIAYLEDSKNFQDLPHYQEAQRLMRMRLAA